MVGRRCEAGDNLLSKTRTRSVSISDVWQEARTGCSSGPMSYSSASPLIYDYVMICCNLSSHGIIHASYVRLDFDAGRCGTWTTLLSSNASESYRSALIVSFKHFARPCVSRST